MVLGLMVSAAMAIQDQCGSNSVYPTGNWIASSSGLHNVTVLEIKDQFSCGNDYAPKPRKSYTITKQRERWTEEEHKKFLEALKLYGRAWRKIEEHIGTKTAVQIRSHAQKFFSKVVRESTGSTTSPVEPIEIPPPRPKRKPMHPYPRKLVHAPELPRRSSSPNLSVSEQDNQSPTSVLSAVALHALEGSSDSNTPISPCSSATPAHFGLQNLLQPNSSNEESGSQSPVLVNAGSIPQEQSPMNVLKLWLPFQDFVKEVSGDGVSTRSLKLFGTTVLVSDTQLASSLTAGSCKSFPSDVNEGKPMQLLPMKHIPIESSSGDTKCAWRQLQHVRSCPGAHCCTQCSEENSNIVEIGSGKHLLCRTFYGGISFPMTSGKQQKPLNVHINSSLEEAQDKEIRKDGSWTGSNSKWVNEEDNFDKNFNVEMQICQSLNKEDKEPDLAFELKPRPSENSAFSVVRPSPVKQVKGFVPYKKRVAESVTERVMREQRLISSDGAHLLKSFLY